LPTVALAAAVATLAVPVVVGWDTGSEGGGGAGCPERGAGGGFSGVGSAWVPVA
jgi:hypothetical protein